MDFSMMSINDGVVISPPNKKEVFEISELAFSIEMSTTIDITLGLLCLKCSDLKKIVQWRDGCGGHYGGMSQGLDSFINKLNMLFQVGRPIMLQCTSLVVCLCASWWCNR